MKFRLKSPWRWRLWLCGCPVWIMLALLSLAAVSLGEIMLEVIDELCEWCKEHEYVEDDGTEIAEGHSLTSLDGE